MKRIELKKYKNLYLNQYPYIIQLTERHSRFLILVIIKVNYLVANSTRLLVYLVILIILLRQIKITAMRFIALRISKPHITDSFL